MMLFWRSWILVFLFFSLRCQSWFPKKPARLSPKFKIKSGYGGIIPSQRMPMGSNKKLYGLLGVAFLTTVVALFNYGFNTDQSFNHGVTEIKDQIVNIASHFNLPSGNTFDALTSIKPEPTDEKSYFVQALDTLKDAVVMPDIDSSIALGGAESVVAIIFRGVSSAGTFRGQFSFAICYRGILGVLRRVTGIPRPVAIIAASLFGAAISVFSRYMRKAICHAQAKGQGRDCCIDRVDQASIAADSEQFNPTYRDIAADVVQWLVYDELSDQFTFDDDEIARVAHFSFGAFAGILSRVIRVQHDNNSTISQPSSRLPTIPGGADITKAAVESGILFLLYEEILEFLQSVVPDELNKKFFFETVLEEIEDEIEDEIEIIEEEIERGIG